MVRAFAGAKPAACPPRHVPRDLGVEIALAHAGKLHVLLKGSSENFSHAKHSLPKQEVAQVRKFIEARGIDPKRDCPV